MKILNLKKDPNLDYKQFIKRTALEKDFKTIIKEPTIVKEDGEIKIIYDILDIDSKSVVEDLRKIKYTVGKRARGLVSQSRIFGFRPRMVLRGDYCSSTSLAHESPAIHAKVCNLALEIEKYYEKYNPQGYKEHLKETDKKIKKNWRLQSKSVFTSGIINKNNPLKYHLDTGNFKKVFSLMIVFKEGVEGGYLSCPEYGIGFELKNNSILMFDGQSIMHGVTPIIYTSPQGHRFSIVYYSLKQMWKCLEIDEELVRIKKIKTNRERIRWNMPKEHKDALLKRLNYQ